jgi:hypothetical protein
MKPVRAAIIEDIGLAEVGERDVFCDFECSGCARLNR